MPHFYNASWLDQRSETEEIGQDSRQIGCVHHKVTVLLLSLYVFIPCIMTKSAVYLVRSLSLCSLSPQGLRFRSRASLRAFLEKSGPGNLDINIFDFTVSKDDEITAPSQGKQRRTKKHTAGQQEEAIEVVDLPPSKAKRASSSLKSSDKSIKSSVDPNYLSADTVPKDIPHVLEAQPAFTSTVDDVTLQRSPQRVGLLRQRLLRLAPTSNQQNALIISQKTQALSHPPAQTLNVLPLAESENKGEDEQGRVEMEIHSRGGNGPSSEQDAANIRCNVKDEVLLPENTGGSCTQVRDSQNSKSDLHSSSLLKQVQVCFLFCSTRF